MFHSHMRFWAPSSSETPRAVSREHFIDPTNSSWISEDGAPSIYREIPEIPAGMFSVRCNEKFPGISGILKM